MSLLTPQTACPRLAAADISS